MDIFGAVRYPAASSSEDIKAKLKPWLGIGNQKEIQLNPHERINYTNRDLPDNFIGRNTLIEARINDFIVHENNDAYTTVFLPWAQTDELHHEVSEYHFNVVFPGRVPHEGVSRLVSSRRESRRAHSQRYGLAFILEQDFFNTDKGKIDYARNIQGIAACVQEGANHDVVASLLTCKNAQKEWNERFGTMPFAFRNLVDVQRTNFAAVAKDIHRIDVIFAHHKKILSSKRVDPNALLVSQGATIYMTMAEGKQTEFQIMGPDGRINIERGPDAMGSFHGVNVFETRSFDVYTDAPAVDLLTRRVQIGEWNEMSFKNWRSRADVSDFQTNWRDIYIYNQNLDDFEKISFVKAFHRCGLFGKDGKWAPQVTELRDIFNNTKARKTNGHRHADDSDSEDEDGVHRVHPNEDPAPFFFVKDPTGASGSMYSLLKTFGQMSRVCGTAKDFEQIGQTIVGKMAIDPSSAAKIFNEGKRLVESIENQGYDQAYWEEVIKANIANSTDSGTASAPGTWQGEGVPSELLDQWGNAFSAGMEWRPNSYGSLNLPEKGVGSTLPAFPAGFANGPGLRTLAAEASNPASGWRDIGKTAASFVGLLDQLIDVLKAAMPESYLLNLRRPWFHIADPLAALFNEAVGVPRDPIFIAGLALANPAEGRAGVKTTSTSDTMRTVWTVNNPGTNTATISSSVDDIRHMLAKTLGGSEQQYSPRSPSHMMYSTSSSAILFPSSYLKDAANLPREIRAYLLMGQQSLPAFQNTMETRLSGMYSGNAENAEKAREALLNFVFHFGENSPSKMRRAVIAMSAMNDQDLARSLEALNITEGARTQKKREAEAVLKDIVEKSGIEEDADLSSVPAGMGILQVARMTGRASASSAQSNLLQKIVSSVRRADAIRASVGIPTVPLSVDAPTGWLSVKIAAGNESASLHDELVADVGKRIAELRAEFQRMGVSSPSLSGNSGMSLDADVTDAGKPVELSRFHRSPLTMSLALLESVAAHHNPLILPSNPEQFHSVPYSGKGDIPTKILNRPQYAHIDAPMRINSVRDLSQASFVVASGDAPAVEETYSSGSKRKISGKRGFSPDESLMAKPTLDAKYRMAREESDDDASDYEGGPSMEWDDKAHEGDWGLHNLRKHDATGERIKRDGPRGASILAGVYTPDAVTRWREANQINEPLTRIATMAFLASPCDERKHWDALFAANVNAPVNILLMRPRMTYMMSTFILMKAGLDTGATFFGHSYFDLGQDVATKMLLGNFTFYSKAFVYRHENVVHLEDVKPEQYEGGSNCAFVTRPEQLKEMTQDTNMRSIIAIAVPLTEDSHEPIMSITGHLPIPDANPSLEGKIRPSYSTYPFYDFIYGFTDLYGQRDLMQENFLDAADRMNVVVLPGMQARVRDEWF